jgi:hypothetical protein
MAADKNRISIGRIMVALLTERTTTAKLEHFRF